VDHADHVDLLRAAVEPAGTWADIGAGTGAFTLALAELLGPGGRIVAVDRDAGALGEAVASVARRFPDVPVEPIRADFAQPLTELPPLDGLVAANSLHFVPRDQQVRVIRALASHLRPGGTFVVVEYDADHGNPWVPHPFRFPTYERLAGEAGLVDARRLGRVPSRFLGGIYSAAARMPVGERDSH
jgi:SAM-dependent methyltransferase